MSEFATTEDGRHFWIGAFPEDEGEPSLTQRDRLVALLTEFGITPEITVDEHHGGEWADTRNPATGHKTYTERIGGQRAEDIRLEAGGDGVGGYNGFVCIFSFDAAGKFLEAGIWE